jgi:hypothetical protein
MFFNMMHRFLGARPQTPRVGFAEAWATRSSAKRNNAFCIFFWKRKNFTTPMFLDISTLIDFLGASPQTPRVGFAEVWATRCSAKRNKAFCFFFFLSEKDGYYYVNLPGYTYSNRFLGGQAPFPLGRLRRSLSRTIFCEPEQRFLLLFIEKECHCWTDCPHLGQNQTS